jgi:phthalate 4,5-dioxygenase oxygenase subunit
MTPEENDLLTRVEGDAPMGQMLQQHHWIPAERSARLEPDGPPLRVRLFGRKFVVWRATDGRVGFFDEACPHRRASLALARNERNALTCIFHGWKFDVSGRVLEVPTQAKRAEEFRERVPLKHYPVREAGGIVWVWIGKGDTPPQFPDFQFTRLQPHQVVVASSVIDCNWVQGVEAVVDAAHVGILHSNFLNKFVGYAKLTAVAAPVYDIERQPYGFRAAALRDLGDGTSYVRVNEFAMPWYGFTSPNDPKLPHRTLFLSVPLDDTHARQWFLRFNVDGEGDRGFGFGLKSYDPDNFTPFADGPDRMWGQDREAMKQGSFSGLGDNVLTEDMVVQLSMGAITDRSQEFLSDADLAVVHMRRMLLQAVRDFQQGKKPVGAGPGIDYANIRATGGIVPQNEGWRDVLPKGVSDSLEAQRAVMGEGPAQ